MSDHADSSAPGSRHDAPSASQSGAAPFSKVISNIPLRRNGLFTGREALFKQVQESLGACDIAVLSQPDASAGGLGKTAIAAEYAYRSARSYDIFWWMPSGVGPVLTERFAALAEALELPGASPDNRPQSIAAVKEWMGSAGRWLVVFDDAPDMSAVTPFLPAQIKGHVLVTTRGPNLKTPSPPVSVEAFSPDEARQFVLACTGRKDNEGADLLAASVRYSPLSLLLAAAYSRSTSTSFADYVRLLEEKSPSAEVSDHRMRDTNVLIRAQLELALKQLARAGTGPRDILALCAFLAPDDIPLSILKFGKEHLSPQLAELVGDPKALSTAFGSLERFGLAQTVIDSVFVHPVVQAVTREGMTDESLRAWAKTALRLAERAFPGKLEYTYPEQEVSRLLPHAYVSAQHAERLEVHTEAMSTLLNNVSLYLNGCKQTPDARRCCERSIATALALFGENHPSVATRVNALGLMHQEMGDLHAARKCYERAFSICEKVYGPTSEAVYSSVHDSMLTMPARNLCHVLEEIGDIEAAGRAYQRAMHIYLQVYGPNHSVVAECANNLGGILHKLGRIERAQKRFEQAIESEENSEKPMQGNLAIYLNNLGSVLLELHDPAEARHRFERAQRLDKNDFGPRDVRVAGDLMNLARSMNASEERDEAIAHYKDALEIHDSCEETDPKAIYSLLRSLAKITLETEGHENARIYYERLLALGLELYGDDCKEHAGDLLNFARMLQDADDFEEALKCLERALVLQTQLSGERSDRIAYIHHRLGGLKHSEGLNRKALEHFQLALDIDTEVHGELHASVARDSYYLGCALVDADEALVGIGHLTRAVELYEETLGKEHTKTRRARLKLGDLSA